MPVNNDQFVFLSNFSSFFKHVWVQCCVENKMTSKIQFYCQLHQVFLKKSAHIFLVLSSVTGFLVPDALEHPHRIKNPQLPVFYWGGDVLWVTYLLVFKSSTTSIWLESSSRFAVTTLKWVILVISRNAESKIPCCIRANGKSIKNNMFLKRANGFVLNLTLTYVLIHTCVNFLPHIDLRTGSLSAHGKVKIFAHSPEGFAVIADTKPLSLF